MLVMTTWNEQYAGRSGTFQDERDGAEQWVAFIGLGRTIDGYVVIEATGPSEVQAAERCMTKCKMLGDIMTLNIQEGFWGPLRRAEAAAKNKAFSKFGKPQSLIYAEGEDDDDKKGEPS